MPETVYSPAVLRHFANAGYGDFDYRPKLGGVARPTLVVVGEHDRTTTAAGGPRRSHEGIPGSELAVIPDSGHMSYVEAHRSDLPGRSCARFLRRAIAA